MSHVHPQPRMVVNGHVTHRLLGRWNESETALARLRVRLFRKGMGRPGIGLILHRSAPTNHADGMTLVDTAWLLGATCVHLPMPRDDDLRARGNTHGVRVVFEKEECVP